MDPGPPQKNRVRYTACLINFPSSAASIIPVIISVPRQSLVRTSSESLYWQKKGSGSITFLYIFCPGLPFVPTTSEILCYWLLCFPLANFYLVDSCDESSCRRFTNTIRKLFSTSSTSDMETSKSAIFIRRTWTHILKRQYHFFSVTSTLKLAWDCGSHHQVLPRTCFLSHANGALREKWRCRWSRKTTQPCFALHRRSISYACSYPLAGSASASVTDLVSLGYVSLRMDRTGPRASGNTLAERNSYMDLYPSPVIDVLACLMSLIYHLRLSVI